VQTFRKRRTGLSATAGLSCLLSARVMIAKLAAAQFWVEKKARKVKASME